MSAAFPAAVLVVAAVAWLGLRAVEWFLYERGQPKVQPKPSMDAHEVERFGR